MLQGYRHLKFLSKHNQERRLRDNRRLPSNQQVNFFLILKISRALKSCITSRITTLNKFDRILSYYITCAWQVLLIEHLLPLQKVQERSFAIKTGKSFAKHSLKFDILILKSK